MQTALYLIAGLCLLWAFGLLAAIYGTKGVPVGWTWYSVALIGAGLLIGYLARRRGPDRR